MLALALAVLLGAPAHNRSEGKSTFRLDDSGQIAVTIHLGELDLPELCNVDLTVAERAREQAKLARCLEQGLPRWLRLTGDERACPLVFLRSTARERTVIIEGEARCAALPRRLVIDWGLFAGAPLDHVSVAMVEQPYGKPRVVLLSRRSSRFVLEVARPWWRLALPAGAAALTLGVGGAWLWRRRRLSARGRAPG